MLEYTISRRDTGARYERPDAVLEVARRVARWAAAPETCGSCSGREAVRLVSGETLCGRCEAQRRARDGGGVALGRRGVHLEPDGMALRGTAIVFDSKSEDLGGFREIVRPEAADRTFAEKIDVLEGVHGVPWAHERCRT